MTRCAIRRLVAVGLSCSENAVLFDRPTTTASREVRFQALEELRLRNAR